MSTKRMHYKIIKAWAKGASIQYRMTSKDRWKDVENPTFISWVMYRVKGVANFKLAQRVTSTDYGEGTIEQVNCNDLYRLHVVFDTGVCATYTKEGRFLAQHSITLQHSNEAI